MSPQNRLSSFARILSVALASLGLVLFVWLSIQVYLSKRDPEGFQAWDGPLAWIVGPPAAESEQAARERMEAGLTALNDSGLAPAERIRRYRSELERAERLLIRSLRAQPAQASALASLAAVRWELDPPLSEEAVRGHLQMIELASQMAPTYPEVQRQLGELLLKMGRQDEAMAYLGRSVELDPRSSREVVELLSDFLVPADEIRQGLPPHPLVLVYLERPYLEESRVAEYVELVAEALDRGAADPALLVRFGNGCLRLKEPGRLIEGLNRLGEQPDATAEAERIKQRSRARAALGNLPAALDDARRAFELEPEVAHRAEYLGHVLAMAGDYEAALEALRHALGRLARAKAGDRTRARVYRKIGQVEESRGRPGLAYDAYLKAVALDADEPHARGRIEEMQRAAGFE